MFIKVDLPAPFSPSSPWISPRATASSMPLLATTPWNRVAAPAIFNRVRVDYGTVVWPGEIDVAPETLYDDSVPTARSEAESTT